MMPITAWALDFVLFDLLAFFAAIFILSSGREGRSSSEFRSRRKMDLSYEPQLPPPALPGELRRPLHPRRVRANGIPAVRSSGFSNARRVFFGAGRSIQNVSGISRLSRTIPLCPCSPWPPCAPPEGATRRAASPATAWPVIAVPDGPRLRDRPCSKQKCRQSPSARLSYSECRRQALVRAPPARNPPIERCRFHPGQRQQSRSARASFRLRPRAARLPPSLAPARRGIPASPSSG